MLCDYVDNMKVVVSVDKDAVREKSICKSEFQIRPFQLPHDGRYLCSF